MTNCWPNRLYPKLAALSDEGVVKEGRRLKHAEGTSHPIRPPSEPQPRGARVRGNRRVSQSEAANRFIAATQHEKMHDERLWELRQKAEASRVIDERRKKLG
jgi:L-lactate dehydrogenase complex protein LldF